MKTFEFKGAFRLKHPGEKQFTRVQNNPFAATRLDFFLISKQLVVVRSEIVASVRSDHKAVELFIDLKSAPRGNGYWKFNVLLLDDQQYVKLIERVISNYLIENPVEQTNAHVRWDTLKCVIRGETIAYCETKHERLRYLQQSLEQQLNLIDCELIRCQDDQQRELIGERFILQRRLD